MHTLFSPVTVRRHVVRTSVTPVPLTVRVGVVATLLALAGCSSGSGGSAAGSASPGTGSSSSAVVPLEQLAPGSRRIDVPATLGPQLTFDATGITPDGQLTGTTTPRSPAQIAADRAKQPTATATTRQETYQPATAVLLDPGTGKVTTLHQPATGWASSAVVADGATAAGLDLLAAGPHGDDGTEFGWQVWCLDRRSGTTRVLQQHTGSASSPPVLSLMDGVLRADEGEHWTAFHGCADKGTTQTSSPPQTQLGPSLWMSVEDGGASSSDQRARFISIDAAGARRTVAEVSSSGTALPNSAGAIWSGGPTSPQPTSVYFATWGGTARPLPAVTIGQSSNFAVVAATGRTFLLTASAGTATPSATDAAAPPARVVAFDPTTARFADLTPGSQNSTLSEVTANNDRYVLIPTAQEQDVVTKYQLIDFGAAQLPTSNPSDLSIH